MYTFYMKSVFSFEFDVNNKGIIRTKYVVISVEIYNNRRST
jgi:hypothetical protein